MPTRTDEIYVMPAFVILAVQNVQDSARWYHDVLEFFVLFEMPGQLIHLRREKHQDILLKPATASDGETSDGRGRGVSLCFSTGAVADVDRLAVRAAERNAAILEGPINRPWNVRELVLSDPDGYRIVLSGGPVEDRNFSGMFPKVAGMDRES